MEDFRVFSKTEEIEKFSNNAGVFRLLSDHEQLEIFESNINPGKSILCQPHESVDTVNVILVMEGRLFHTNTRRWIEAGDRIEYKDIIKTQHLSVTEKTRIIRVRTSRHFVKQTIMIDEIYDLIHQIQEKDDYTESHCNDVGNLAAQLATYLDMDQNIIENVLFAGKVHDVGKTSIPLDILVKPGRLDKDEYEEIKKHPEHGKRILIETVNNHNLAEIVYQHHERLDGSGYPNGLKNSEIRIESQLLAVVDSYDAMTTDRPYRKGMDKMEALNELSRYKGIWYNNEIVEAFIELMHHFENHSIQIVNVGSDKLKL